MPRIKPATRIAITLGFISATIVWIAHGLGLIPSPGAHVQEKRLAIVKTLAGSISGFASSSNGVSNSTLQRSLELATRVNKDVVSVGVRGKSRYMARSKDHQANWKSTKSEKQPNQAELEVFANKRTWGTLEVCFLEEDSQGILGFMFPLCVVVFVSLLTTAFSWFVLNRSFRYLNPSKVVPKRVRSAFDTLTEGLVLIDKGGEIAHVNKAFGEIIDLQGETDSLIGASLNGLGWQTQSDKGVSAELPWFQCIEKEASVTGQILEIGENENRRKFFVNSAPIFGNKSDCRGAMISFDDVTEMEQKKIELAALVKTLRSSRDEVERQNEQLTFLASYDPLTECMNRRAFWIEFEQMWADAEPVELSLLMIDVDHFKAFNDTYGHSFGDIVLKKLGEILRNTVGDRGLVSRFGGEEFVVAFSKMKLNEAVELTHEIHRVIQDIDIEGKNITASIGFTNREFKAMDGQHMLDQADLSLYAAKRNGRNRVMRFDECDAADDALMLSGQAGGEQEISDDQVPRTAVAGFVKAIGYRCQATSEHSGRVARLCKSVGKTFLEPRDLYRLEVAAQLHEIGRIGVPDSIFNKSTKLSDADWQIIKQHNEIGLQLTQSVFAESTVPQIIETHQKLVRGDLDDETSARSNGEPNNLDEVIKTSVAILGVCDEFDFLIHSNNGNDRMRTKDAIARIKNNTPSRYRADIVHEFIEHFDNFGAEQSPSQEKGAQDCWPPVFQSAIGASSAVESCRAEPPSPYSKATDEPEAPTDTSLDLEISNTIALANELLGLSEETRSITVEGPKKKQAAKPKKTNQTAHDMAPASKDKD